MLADHDTARGAQRAFEAGHYASAARLLERLLARSPGDAAALANLGLCRHRLGDLPGAVTAFRAALAVEPGFVPAWANLGDALRAAGQPEEADKALRRALVLAPDFAPAHASLGLLAQQYGHVGAAILSLRQALAAAPDSPDYWCNLGIALQDAGAIGEASATFRKALALASGHPAAASNLQLCAQYAPDLSARELRALAASWGAGVEAAVASAVAPAPTANARRAGPLRIGYVSGDFFMHPVGWFFTAVAEAHDSARVEIFCYANQTKRDALTNRIEAAVDHWVPVIGLDDEALVERIRADSIDVLVDLSGHTSGNRLGVFARRAAPLQFAWLGYFASTGLTSIDAAIFSAAQLGPGGEAYFVEPVERIARSHFCYAPPDYAPAVLPRPVDAPVVFGSFGNASKFGDEVIRTWAAVLAAVPAARLVLKWRTFSDAGIRAAMAARFARAGADPARVELRGPSPHADMLAQYHDIDIALDPFPFSGALTTCEALWMGVPVVTLEHQRPVARQTLALSGCVGLADLVAATPAAYVATCAALARDRMRLRDLRAGLRETMRASELLDGAGMARALEQVYRRHAERAGLLPGTVA